MNVYYIVITGMSEVEVSETSAPVRLIGLVKWFNNKAGYGFITVHDDVAQNGDEIFVHYSSIRVADSQYKYLVPGEYVEFVLSDSGSDEHKNHATDITGIRGGPILCETRRLIAESQQPRQVEESVERPRVQSRNVPSTPRGPRRVSPEVSQDDTGFVKVQRRTQKPRSVQKK
jgi:cold shock CspA family protein